MKKFTPCFVAGLLWGFGVFASESERVYEVSPIGFWRHGAFDYNILADDICMDHGGILTNISMTLAIRGHQECRLWIFDALDRPPIYTVDFINRPSVDWQQTYVYSFPMHLDVPGKIYVGISAQGDGWTDDGYPHIDYSFAGETLSIGRDEGRGFYWWGTAEGGVLNQGGNFGTDDHFWMKVDMIRPVIEDISVRPDSVSVYLAETSSNVVYQVYECSRLSSNTWRKAGEFAGEEAFTMWSSSLDPSASNCFYRVVIKPEAE